MKPALELLHLHTRSYDAEDEAIAVQWIKFIQADALQHAVDLCGRVKDSLTSPGELHLAAGVELCQDLIAEEADKLEKS